RRDDQSWTLVNASKTAGKHLSVLRTTENGTVYAMQSDNKSPASIGTLDTSSGEYTQLFSDPVAEVSQRIWSTDQTTLLGVVTE
ncbi:hypothetical protein, partial [Escherichia coli]